MTEYPTLTALMAGREPGSVKVLAKGDAPSKWFRPGARHDTDSWTCLGADGHTERWCDEGPWLIISEDAPALDTLRLQIAAKVLAGLFSTPWDNRHAYVLAEADALIKEARK